MHQKKSRRRSLGIQSPRRAGRRPAGQIAGRLPWEGRRERCHPRAGVRSEGARGKGVAPLEFRASGQEWSDRCISESAAERSEGKEAR